MASHQCSIFSAYLILLICPVKNGGITKGSRLKVHALNDYWVEIPMSDVVNYNILLASKIDGKAFSIRDFGPYFVIYPVDERREELNSPVKFSKFVWQVDSITVVDK